MIELSDVIFFEGNGNPEIKKFDKKRYVAGNSLPRLLPFALRSSPEQLVHHLDRTEIPAHRAGLRLPVPLMDLPGMFPIERKPELLVPVEFVPGLSHLHLAVHPTPAFHAFIFSCTYYTIMHNFIYFRAL
jgi:hypothetical protein